MALSVDLVTVVVALVQIQSSTAPNGFDIVKWCRTLTADTPCCKEVIRLSESSTNKKDYPKCYEDGYHAPIRCSDSECTCANKQTGAEIPGSFPRNGVWKDCEGSNMWTPQALKKADQICVENRELPCCKSLWGEYEEMKVRELQGGHFPADIGYSNCDEEGYFKTEQCLDAHNICYCVDKNTGHRIKGSKKTGRADCDTRSSDATSTSKELPQDHCEGDECKCPPGMTGVRPFCQPEEEVEDGETSDSASLGNHSLLHGLTCMLLGLTRMLLGQ